MESRQIYEIYAEFIRKKRKYTNCYFTPEELQEECREKKSRIENKEGSLLIWIREHEYTKLYFSGDDFGWTNVFGVPENEVVAIEIVTKGDPGEYDFSKKIKCREVIQYTRFRRNGFAEPDNLHKTEPEYCSLNDLSEIRQMLDTNFSPIGDYIPDDVGLNTFIQNKSIICLRNGANLKGYLIFEDKGKTSYIRNVCVDNGYRGKGVGKELMSAYFYMHRDFKGFTLWCKTTNGPAINLYTKVGGYHNEDLHDYIYIC